MAIATTKKRDNVKGHDGRLQIHMPRWASRIDLEDEGESGKVA